MKALIVLAFVLAAQCAPDMVSESGPSYAIDSVAPELVDGPTYAIDHAVLIDKATEATNVTDVPIVAVKKVMKINRVQQNITVRRQIPSPKSVEERLASIIHSLDTSTKADDKIFNATQMQEAILLIRKAIETLYTPP